MQDIKALEERIRVIEDRQAIRKLEAKYAYTCDVFDWDGFMSVFAEESSCDFGFMGSYKTKDEMDKFFREVVPQRLSFMRHFIFNESIEITSETTATGEWYFLTPGAHIGTNRALWFSGKYDEEFVKEKGEWKIKFLKCTFAFVTGYDTGWVKEERAKF